MVRQLNNPGRNPEYSRAEEPKSPGIITIFVSALSFVEFSIRQESKFGNKIRRNEVDSKEREGKKFIFRNYQLCLEWVSEY